MSAARNSLLALGLVACKSRLVHDDAAPRRIARDAASAAVADAAAWPELATFPHVEPVRVIALPARTNVPRFDVGGPAVIGDVAVVASSQFGFVAVDYRRGQIAWTKPAGAHVAPPLVDNGSIVLVGDCISPPDAADQLLGCARVVAPTGADESYVAIHGRARDVADFAAAPGTQRTWRLAEHRIAWRRGSAQVAVDLVTGAATPMPAADPPLVVHYKEHTWEIARDDAGALVAREHGKDAWRTERHYTELLGAVYLPEQSPMVRVSNAGAFAGHSEMNLFDIDATGSLHGQVAFPVPGVGLYGHAIDAVGNTALAVRLDASLERDFIAGYAANALLMWVYPLPQVPRADPVGLAVAPDAVIAFHDGDTLTILPELSAPPTAPGAAKPPSENATP